MKLGICGKEFSASMNLLHRLLGVLPVFSLAERWEAVFFMKTGMRLVSASRLSARF